MPIGFHKFYMSTLQMSLIIILFLCLGCAGLILALQVAGYFSKKAISIRKLFIGLKPKLFMTAGLGIFFCCFYACVVLLASHLIDAEMKQQIFALALQHPIFFAYVGLALFVAISLGILVLRSVIKKLYNRY